MKKYLLFIPLLILSISSLYAQSAQHKVEIEVINYQEDIIIIGYYFGDRQLVLDTLQRNENDKFILEGEEALNEGVYLLLLSPKNRYIQFIINKDEQNFSISLDTADLSNPVITGSPDNQLFLDYVTYLNSQSNENQKLTQQINAKKEIGESIEVLETLRLAIDGNVKAYQNQLIENHPESVTSKLIRSTKDIFIPQFEGSPEEIKSKKYFYYKQHYFDNLDLAEPTFLRTPFMHNKIDSYLNKLTPQTADSISYAIDRLLGKMKPAPETYKFYLSYFLNTYAASKIVGFDGIYVHMIDKYYSKGEADWVEKENLGEMITQANAIRPTLIGKKAQEIKVYRKDKTPIALSDIESKYLLLYFWAPDCGHCKKATPFVVDFYKKYKDSLGVDIEVLAVCTKHRDKEPSCWEAVEDKGMDLWINASDVNHLSRFKIKYNIQTTPQIFILNRDREIIMKKIGAEYLDEVMQEIIRVDEHRVIEDQLKE